VPETRLDDLSPHARELAVASTAWSDRHWDAEAGLLAFSYGRRTGVPRKVHIVRNSIWYALGLLLRNGSGDTDKACRTISAVLDNQFDEPGTPFHGTFYRWVGEAHPPEDATMWKDYDPNWRQFIGLGLAMILDEYSGRLPGELVARIDASIRLAVIGEPEGRCPPSYTNIALMKAGLMTFAGDRYGNPEWAEKGEAFAEAVMDLFRPHNTFLEYNSPTYYGVNFYALGFWRKHARSSRLVQWGQEMEAELWRDTARYYHAGLRNIAGPYTRSYGMDMRQYSALVGLCIWLAVGHDCAPFPDGEDTEFSSEFCYGPCLSLLDVVVPDDALPHLTAFSGPRHVERTISTQPRRIATAWLGDDRMIGAESTTLDGPSVDIFIRLSDQFHPAVFHWQTPSGRVGWGRLRYAGPVDARAERDSLSVSIGILPELERKLGESCRSVVFELCAPGIDKGAIEAEQWGLPGLRIDVDTPIPTADLTCSDDTVEIRYTIPPSDGSTRFDLRLVPG